MRTLLMTVCIIAVTTAIYAQGMNEKNTDVYKTSIGDLSVTLLGHGTLMLKFNGKVIHVDPYSNVADYDKLPKADLIILTHDHGDHLDPAAIEKIKTDKTEFIMNGTCFNRLKIGKMLKNGDKTEFKGIPIEAIAAYNIVHKRSDGKAYHPEGEGNGYIFTFGDTKLYVAGDTENTPEMKTLRNIDIAFLPMNLPYTMTPEMVVDAAKAFKPKYLYPYHHGGKADLDKLEGLLKNTSVKVVIKNDGNDIVSR